MLNVVIQRKKHIRGQKSPSCMRNENGSMCCLGFAAVAAGIPKECLMYKSSPCELFVTAKQRKILEKLELVDKFKRNSSAAVDLMIANDSKDLSGKEKEKEIIRLGKQIGINFSFV